MAALIAGAPGIARAQVAVVDPSTGNLTEASAATTIMLDPLYALSQDWSEAELAPIPMIGGAVMMSHPERYYSYATARVGDDGTLSTGCVPGHALPEAIDKLAADSAEEVAR